MEFFHKFPQYVSSMQDVPLSNVQVDKAKNSVIGSFNTLLSFLLHMAIVDG